MLKQKPLKRQTKFSIKENKEMNNVVNPLNNSTIRSEQIPDDSLVCSSEFDCERVTPHLNASTFEVSSGDEFDSKTITSDDENCEYPALSIQQPALSILQLSSKGTIVTINESSFWFIDRELIIREFRSFTHKGRRC